MKNNVLKIFIISIITLSVIAYFLGLTDSAFQKVYISKNFLSYIINSIKYFVFWVLPYWWILILGISFLVSILYWLLSMLFKNNRNR